MATSLFEYDCEAVRVRAKRVTKANEEEHRKFSVDPNLTSYDILHSILTRAFDVSGDFVIYFSSSGEWLPLLSDWDLDVAILSAADPCLNLMITERKIKQPPLPSDQESVDVDEAISPQIQMTTPAAKTSTSTALVPSSSSNDIPMLQSLKQHVEKSILPGLTSKFHRALNIAEESIVPKGQQLLSMLDSTTGAEGAYDDVQRCLAERDFKQYLNKVGEVVRPRELRLAVYQRGVETQLRKVLWKHLLGVYPVGLTGRQRVDYMKKKTNEYEDLKQTWMGMMLQGRVTDDLKYVTNMVKKDVLRTDRQLNFYSGEGNANITVLYNILTTFALNHPSVGYCQGMSDLLSPILVVMQDEGHAYVSFCALMSRIKSNFFPDGKTMTKKFEHLSQGLLFYDPEFYAYLKLRHADDLLYCYRWLLLEMKREFSFEDACTALEVLWASLPPKTKTSNAVSDDDDGGTILYEERFGKKESSRHSTPSFSGKRETTFANVVTLRKRLSSTDDSPTKRKGSLLSQQRGRIQSASSAEEKAGSGWSGGQKASRTKSSPLKKSQSLLSNSRIQNTFSSTSNSDQKSGSSSAQDDEMVDDNSISTKKNKKVTDLNEFFKLSSSSEAGANKNVEQSSPKKTKTLEDKRAPSVEIETSDVATTDGPECSTGKNFSLHFNRLPPPAVLGDGNPFLMFMCIACILQHRDYILEQQLDYQEIAMYFDRMVRRHNVRTTLNLARKMFAEYLNDDWKRDTMNNSPGDVLEAC